MSQRVRVYTASRLHFGLLALPRSTFWPNSQDEPRVPARRFGGVGLMIEKPGLELIAQPSPEWSAEGPLAGRALGYVRQFAASLNKQFQPQRLTVVCCAPEHAGFGTGTQLGLAVARALAVAWGLPTLPVADLATRVGRGLRSALGVHGFEQGGFLVEGGKGRGESLSPLLARVPFPEPWRVVVALPHHASGAAGQAEMHAFEVLQQSGIPLEQTDALCRLALLGMLPALAEDDLQAFGEALYDYNRRAGLMFASVQGGPYASARSAEMVEFLRARGIQGVGQSSWGPALFAIVGDADEAEHWTEQLRARFALTPHDVWWTRAANSGASAETD